MKFVPHGLAILLTLCLAGSKASADDDQAVWETKLAAHLKVLKSKAPKGFTIVPQRPFVVIGDESPARVRQRARGTVGWAVDRLKKDFFTNDPRQIIDVWLFKDKASYERHTLKLFGDRPGTPFGYYSPSERALIMNIATGGGTLVHEIVHPFMEANFPACPPWFNEGLGSLYEQSRDKNGHIVGLTNWRLPILQKAIRDKKTVPLETLLAMNEAEFYGDDYSGQYPQARYLCYYLQERGLLVTYYIQFTANAKSDPTGVKTLKKVLREKDLEAFRKRWEAYVLKLKFP